MKIYQEPIVKFNIEWLEEITCESIKDLTHKNIHEKLDSWLKKIAAHDPKVQVEFEIKITKNKKWKYNWTFVMTYPWIKEPLRYEREDFENLYDLINHAFANFKSRLSWKWKFFSFLTKRFKK